VRRPLTLGRPHRNTAIIEAHLQDRRPLALVVTLILCLFAFVVLSSTEAWAKEQASSTEQQPPPTTGESTIIVNGTQVATPTPLPMPPPVVTTPPVETSPTETPPQPLSNSVNSVLPKAEPEPAAQPTPLQSTVMVTTTGSETVGPSVEPASALQQSEPAPTKTPSTTTPSEPAPVAVSAAPTPDLGSPEIQEVPAAAEEVPAALPTGLSAPSEVSEPVIPGPALQQQVAHGVASQEQAQSLYSSSGIAPTSAAVRPLTNFVGTSTAAVANAAANVLGTFGGWLAAEAPSSGGEDSSSSSSGGTTTPEPFDPVSPQPLGSSFISLLSGGGAQSSAGGAGATLLLGVLFLASIVLLRRDLRMYLVSCEVAKPSSALLSPLERPG
jgi:hypothetical protein